MIYAKQNGKCNERNVCQHYTAEQENYRRNYRQRQRFQLAVFVPTNNPKHNVRHAQSAVNRQIDNKCAIKPKIEIGKWNIENHQGKACVSAHLFQYLHHFILIFICKAVLMLNSVYYIGNHNYRYYRKTVIIKPTHNLTRFRHRQIIVHCIKQTRQIVFVIHVVNK